MAIKTKNKTILKNIICGESSFEKQSKTGIPKFCDTLNKVILACRKPEAGTMPQVQDQLDQYHEF